MSQPRVSGDSVRAYLRDIGRIPLLEHEEEILLGRKVQRLMEIKTQLTSSWVTILTLKQSLYRRLLRP